MLRVASEDISETALGDRGAERRAGKGHILTRLEGAPKPDVLPGLNMWVQMKLVRLLDA